MPVPQHARMELLVHAGVRIDPRRAPDWIVVVVVVVADRRVGVIPVLRQEEEERICWTHVMRGCLLYTSDAADE